MEAPRKVVEGEHVLGNAQHEAALPDSNVSLNPVTRHDVPVLLLSASVGNRKLLERMLEGLGLSVQVAATVRAARAALHSAPHAAALVDFPVPGMRTAEDLLGGLPPGHAPPLLTLGSTSVGHALLEGGVPLSSPVTPDVLREALAPLLPHYSLAPLPGQAQRVLLNDLISKPGMLGVTLLDRRGQSVAQQGEGLPAHLGLRLVQALEATQSLGSVMQGGEMHTAQLEYEHRTLLIAAHGPYVIACILRDPSSSSLIRYLLRTRLAA
ncbi:MAG: hypothetical protein JWQ08_1116 [Deinococcus sp.]|nr:hypothetical protein [Deinococcus sp.]